MASQTFHAQQGWQKFNVPKGVKRVHADLQGAGSGNARGGRVQGWIKVQDDDVLYLLVGTAGGSAPGHQGGSGGFGGGGEGGDGSSGRSGGRGGGGAAAIRMNGTDGTIKAVAGGAGGRSGDGGDGGDGGPQTGQHGNLGNAGGGQAGNATGGTQLQGGKGGASGGPSGLDGKDGDNGGLGKGGHGGQQTTLTSDGGGGGGGGYRAGGGGVASLVGQYPGGGGGGGSNFTGGFYTGTSNSQGGGNTGDAVIVITWDSPPPANQPPSAPSDAKVDGKPESDGMSTRSTGRVKVSAIVRDQDQRTVDPAHTGDPATQKHGPARLLVRYSAHSDFHNAAQERSTFVDYGKRAEVTLTGLAQNTRYYLRLYAEDKQGKLSNTYNAVNFWTNRSPNAPLLQAPADNAIVLETDTTTFDWSPQDPDDNDHQSAFEIKWRRTSADVSGDWQTEKRTTSFDNFLVGPGEFKNGSYYEWTVRTRDDQQAWGPFAIPRSFYVTGVVNVPTPLSPRKGQAVDVSGPVTVRWKFNGSHSGDAQTRADVRYRVVGAAEWVTDIGTGNTAQEWTFGEGTFVAGYQYEWQVRTYTTTSPSDWSDSATFWTYSPAQIISDIIATEFTDELGCGTHRAFIYDRGGQVYRGEVTPLETVMWSRKRDDIGSAQIVTNGFGSDCGELLKTVHTWIHELVIFRDGKRVFEGPITLITDTPTGFTIEAKDVMGYVYRRIQRQGYNDSWHQVQGVVEGLPSVVQRAGLIVADALSRNDPNVLPYLTLLSYNDDARESRVLKDYQKTAWEEIDDMAANAGLDYSVIGRRIIFNDTHRPVGRLPEMRSEMFSDPPVISEYGMLLADYYAVTNNTGLWGAVEKEGSPYGGVELLVSSFTEIGAADTSKMTRAQIQQVEQVLVEQARRGIASRYPAPYIVRVPDNSMLMPTTPVDINQLVPGVWIPLRAEGTVIEVTQWQKLDAVTVTEAKGAEQVRVTMSPAPNAGQDPDANVTDATEDT